MQTSTLSFATSIPTTTRSFCAIIQLPSLLGPGSKPMQLFGLRKTPDLSLAPRQALGLRARPGADPGTGGCRSPARSHILADFADTRARRKPLKPLRAGMPGDLGGPVVTILVCFLHFAREAAGASSARHSPRPRLGGNDMHNSGASRRGKADPRQPTTSSLRTQ